MWPSFTVRVLQDPEIVHKFLGISRESWAVLAQWANAFVIGLAALVASKYPQEKDRLAVMKLMRNYLAGLKLFRSSVEGYFYIVFDGSELPNYYNSTFMLNQARDDFFKLENKKEEIVSVLPANAIEPFNNFLSFYKTVEYLSHENYDSAKEMGHAWKGAKEGLDKVIYILEKKVCSTKDSYSFFSKIAKRVNKKK